MKVSYNETKTKLALIEQRIDTIRSTVNKSRDRYFQLAESLDIDTEAMALATACIKEQVDVKQFMEALDNNLLEALFQRDLKLEMQRTENGISPVLFENGIPDDLDEHGDGVNNVVGVGNRLSVMGFKPDLEPFIYLDEPMRGLSTQIWSRAAVFLDKLAKSQGIQIVINTHAEVEFPYTVFIRKDQPPVVTYGGK